MVALSTFSKFLLLQKRFCRLFIRWFNTLGSISQVAHLLDYFCTEYKGRSKAFRFKSSYFSNRCLMEVDAIPLINALHVVSSWYSSAVTLTKLQSLEKVRKAYKNPASFFPGYWRLVENNGRANRHGWFWHMLVSKSFNRFVIIGYCRWKRRIRSLYFSKDGFSG